MSETTIVRGLIDRNSATALVGDVEVQALITRAERLPAPAGSSRLEVMAGRTFSADHVKALSSGILTPAEAVGADAHIDRIGAVLSADIPTLIADLDNVVPGVTPPATLRHICETSLMSSPRIWAEYSGLPDPAKKDFLARVMKRDGRFQKELMTGYAELTDPAALAARSGGVESEAVRRERTSLQAEITADQARIAAIDAQLTGIAAQMRDFESSFDAVSGLYVEGASASGLANLSADEGRLRMLIDLRNQEVGPLQEEITKLKSQRDTYFGRRVKENTNKTKVITGPAVAGFVPYEEKTDITFVSDTGDTGSSEYGALQSLISTREGDLGRLKDQISVMARDLSTTVERKRLLQQNHSELVAERTRLNTEKSTAETALAPKLARQAELGTAGETIATAYKDRLYSIIPQAFQTTINEQLAELSKAQDEIDADRLARAVTVNGQTISNRLYDFARNTTTGERDHVVAMNEWRALMTAGPGYVDHVMEREFGTDIFRELQKNPDNYLAVRTDLLKKMYRYRTEYRRTIAPSTGFMDSFRVARETREARNDGQIPEEELKRFVDLAGEQVLRSGLANPGVQQALSELTGSAQLDPSLPLEGQLRGKNGADLQAILSILFLVGGASLLSLLGGRP